ncbi:MAG: autotransporter domain-containing protein [Mariprofundaceae bacterium]|nr:autotransporter domain-containing protein [Mariprofundaceae bacterium]
MLKKLQQSKRGTIVLLLKIMTIMFITLFSSFSAYAAAIAPPTITITSITPSSGPVAGGTNVTITGTNFTGAPAVTIGGAAATGVVVVNATSITATTPVGTAGARDVAVTTQVGTATNMGLFTYVSSNSNPALDSSVQGQIVGQVLSIQHFVNAQNRSLSSRLQRLHSGFITGSSSSSRLMTPTTIQEALYALEPYLLASNSSELPVISPTNAEENHKVTGLWFGSDLNYGSINAEGVSNNRFTSGSLSIGMDHLLKSNLIIGAVAGFGWDTTKIGAQGTETTTTSPSVSMYASYNPNKNTFIDGWLGYGRSSLNNRRWESTDNVFVHGDRTANSYFGSLSLSTAVQVSTVKFEPFVRGEFLYSTLGSYNESGNSTRLLNYNAMKFNAASAVVGAVASYDISTSSAGTFTPLIEGQYMQTNNISATQNLFFSNAASTVYSLDLQSIPTNISTAKLGLRYQNKQGITGEVKLGFSKGNNSYISRVLNAQMSIPF